MRHLTELVISAVVLSSALAPCVGAQAVSQPPTRLPATRVMGDTMNIVTVQNDRAKAVTVYMENGAFDRRIGVLPAGKVATLRLPAWAISGRNSLRLCARPDGENADLDTQSFPISGAVRVGLLVPPTGGISKADSMAVKLTSEELASTTLTVNNQRDRAAVVYAEQGTYSIRLGEVAANRQATLRFPKSIIGADNSVRVFVRPVGGSDLSTQTLKLTTGDHIALEIAK